MSLLDSIIANTQSGPQIIAEQHDQSKINWVAGLTDPGEMIMCNYLPEIRRRDGEQDKEYQERITPIVMALPLAEQQKIMNAAIQRAQIDTSTGKAAVFSAFKPAWHGLGVTVDRATSSKEAIKLATMDWEAIKKRLQYEAPDGTRKDADAWGVIRGDTGAYLGTVGSRYKPIQNTEAFEFLDGVLGEFGAQYETAGCLYGGSKIWLLAQMPKQRFHVNGDDMLAYCLFTNSHDGSEAAACYPTNVRVECANTLRTAGKHDQHKGLKIRHTGSIKGKIERARQALGFAVNKFEEFREQAETLVHKDLKRPGVYLNNVLDQVLTVTEADMKKGSDILAATIAVTQADRDMKAKQIEAQFERRRDILQDMIVRYESERCHPKGSMWAGFNAVTEYADHNKVGRQVGTQDERASRRFESVIAGEADVLKQTALQVALAQ